MLLHPAGSSDPGSPRRPGSSRPGLTLLEVIVALAIFLMALVAIGQLLTFASDRALDVQQRTQALLFAQRTLAEVQAGVLPLESREDVPCEKDENYKWSVLAEQGQVPGLWNVSVRVVRERASHTRVEVVLSRMMLDPKQVGSTQDQPPTVQSSGSVQNSTAGSGTSGTGSSPSSTPAATR